jgi:hypothetical protein
MPKKLKFRLILTKVTGNLREYQCTFLIIPSSVLLRMRNLKTKVVQKLKTHILYSTTFFFFENHSIYEIMWKNPVEPENTAHARCILHTKDYRQQQ